MEGDLWGEPGAEVWGDLAAIPPAGLLGDLRLAPSLSPGTRVFLLLGLVIGRL